MQLTPEGDLQISKRNGQNTIWGIWPVAEAGQDARCRQARVREAAKDRGFFAARKL